MFDHPSVLLGCPSGSFGFSNDENSTSKSDVSVICLGGLQVSCCGYFPSLENIRVEAHNISSPFGIPSDQPELSGGFGSL